MNPWEIVRENSSYDEAPQMPGGVRSAVLRALEALERDPGCHAFFAPPTRGNWRPLALDLADLAERVANGFYRRVESLQHHLLRVREIVARGGFGTAPPDRVPVVLTALDRLLAQCTGRFAALQQRQDAHSAAAVAHRLAARRTARDAEADAVYRDDFLLADSDDDDDNDDDTPRAPRTRAASTRRRRAVRIQEEEDDGDEEEEEIHKQQQQRRYSTRGTRRRPARFDDDYVDEDEEEEEEENQDNHVVLRLRLGEGAEEEEEDRERPPQPLRITVKPDGGPQRRARSESESDGTGEHKRRRLDSSENDSERDVKLIVHEDERDDECVAAADAAAAESETHAGRRGREVAELVRAAEALGRREGAGGRAHRRPARWDEATETAVSRQGALLPRPRRTSHLARPALRDDEGAPAAAREGRRASIVWTHAEMASDSEGSGVQTRTRRASQSQSRYNLR